MSTIIHLTYMLFPNAEGYLALPDDGGACSLDGLPFLREMRDDELELVRRALQSVPGDDVAVVVDLAWGASSPCRRADRVELASGQCALQPKRLQKTLGLEQIPQVYFQPVVAALAASSVRELIVLLDSIHNNKSQRNYRVCRTGEGAWEVSAVDTIAADEARFCLVRIPPESGLSPGPGAEYRIVTPGTLRFPDSFFSSPFVHLPPKPGRNVPFISPECPVVWFGIIEHIWRGWDKLGGDAWLIRAGDDAHLLKARHVSSTAPGLRALCPGMSGDFFPERLHAVHVNPRGGALTRQDPIQQQDLTLDSVEIPCGKIAEALYLDEPPAVFTFC